MDNFKPELGKKFVSTSYKYRVTVLLSFDVFAYMVSGPRNLTIAVQ